MDDALMLCRAVHFAASLSVFGIQAFQTMLAPEALARSFDRRLKHLSIGGGAASAMTGAIWVTLLSASDGVGDVSPEALRSILFNTQFGVVWQWHMALSLGLLVLVCWDRHFPERMRWPAIGLVATLHLATLGLVGHAVLPSGIFGVASRITQAVHLLAAGFWLGSLLPVILCLRIRSEEVLYRDAMTALRRFSNVGHASVALVIITGVISMALIEGRLTLELTTPYQQLLAAKIAVVLAMVILAITNRYWLVPRLKRDAAALERIRRVCIAVFCLGLGAVALVSVFGMLQPN